MASAPRHVRIFLASPGDVAAEREIALRVLDDLPYDPLLRGRITVEDVAWDKRGAGAPILAGVTPQDSIAAGLPRPGECDIVVVIFWSRMGTPLPTQYRKPDGSRYESGTEWEYEDAVRAYQAHGSPYVLLYRRKQPVFLNADDLDLEQRRVQYEKVKRFFGALRDADGAATGGYTEYEVPGDFRQHLEHDIKSLIARLLNEQRRTGPASSVALPEPWKGSPFPGLRAFTAADGPIFFGREREIDALVARIQEHPFVAVVGASGSGKSSLVAAGVIPRLRSTAASAGLAEWSVLQLTPDLLGSGDPFASLAAAILQALPGVAQKGLAAALSAEPGLLATLLPPQTLVYVDQFEELFTTVQPSLRAPFVDALPRAHTIITVRADFYGSCVEMPALARLIEDGTFPLGAPGMGALYAMVTRPASRAALTFEEGLPERILDDTGQEPGALALMAYTLDELYRRDLTNAAYEELGGVRGAIGKRSETVFGALDTEAQAALPRVFRELVEVDERGTATRQRAPLTRVAATQAAKRLTDALTEARLLVRTRGANHEAVVEVAHEALFRSWPRLEAWIGVAAADLRLLRHVRNAAAEWESSGRRDDFLWSHERLEPVYALQARMNLELDAVVTAFIRPESERILNAMREGLSDARHRASIERLVEIGPAAVRSLVASLQYARDRETRSEINDALWSSAEIAVPHLLEMMMSGQEMARARAIEALTHLNPEAGVHLLPELLADGRNPQVRVAAVFLAAYAQAEQAIPALCAIVDGDDPALARAALVALATFDSPVTLEQLLRATEGEVPVASVALDLIADLAGRSPIRALPADQYRLRPYLSRNRVLHHLPALTQAAAHLTRASPRGSIKTESTLHRLLNANLIEAAVSHDSPDAEIEALFRILVETRSPAIADLLGSRRRLLQRHAVRAVRELASISDRPRHLHLGLEIDDPNIHAHLRALLRHEDEETRDAARSLQSLPKQPLST